MFRRQGCVMVLLAVVGLSLAAGRAGAGWYIRPYVGWRLAAWQQAVDGGALPGGKVVGSTSFAGGNPQAGALTAAQWQQLITAQQMPAYSAAQWQQLVTGQAPKPQAGPARPGQPQQTSPLLGPRQRWPQLDAVYGPARPQSPPPAPPADGK